MPSFTLGLLANNHETEHFIGDLQNAVELLRGLRNTLEVDEAVEAIVRVLDLVGQALLLESTLVSDLATVVVDQVCNLLSHGGQTGLIELRTSDVQHLVIPHEYNLLPMVLWPHPSGAGRQQSSDCAFCSQIEHK